MLKQQKGIICTKGLIILSTVTKEGIFQLSVRDVDTSYAQNSRVPAGHRTETDAVHPYLPESLRPALFLVREV